jgi:hypothetical protein
MRITPISLVFRSFHLLDASSILLRLISVVEKHLLGLPSSTSVVYEPVRTTSVTPPEPSRFPSQEISFVCCTYEGTTRTES